MGHGRPCPYGDKNMTSVQADVLDGIRIISSDDHVGEQPDLWTRRLDPQFMYGAPRLREIDGVRWLCSGDQKLVAGGSGDQTGVRFKNPDQLTGGTTVQPAAVRGARPGGHDPFVRVKDMDADGIDASIVYPSTGLRLYAVLTDRPLLSALFRAYNDWLAEEFCKPFPHRLKGIGMLNLDDVGEGVKELQRCARIGLVGAMIPVHPPEGRPYGSPEYEPLWASAQDLGMPLSLHIGTPRPAPFQEYRDLSTMRATYMSASDHWIRISLGDMIMTGVFERYPRLQAGSVEHELSWAVFFLWKMDYVYTQKAKRPSWHRFAEAMLPSDYFHRNCFIGFQEEGNGIRLRDVIGVDNLQWGSDYPHPESTFPKSREILARLLADCTREEKAKILGGNAARVYRMVE